MWYIILETFWSCSYSFIYFNMVNSYINSQILMRSVRTSAMKFLEYWAGEASTKHFPVFQRLRTEFGCIQSHDWTVKSSICVCVCVCGVFLQVFPSLCALDVHVRFLHKERWAAQILLFQQINWTPKDSLETTFMSEMIVSGCFCGFLVQTASLDDHLLLCNA